jgi:hypothetical protein
MRLFTEPGWSNSLMHRFFSRCADPTSRPLNFHCREGKDRTGALSALLLLAVGVSESDIVRDFEVSNVLWERAVIRKTGINFVWMLTGNWRCVLPPPAMATLRPLPMHTPAHTILASHGSRFARRCAIEQHHCCFLAFSSRANFVHLPNTSYNGAHTCAKARIANFNAEYRIIRAH